MILRFVSFFLFSLLSYNALAIDGSGCELPAFEDIQGRFEQSKQLTIFPEPIKSDGRFIFRSGDGLQWITESPIHSELKFDENGIAGRYGAGEDASSINKIIANIFLSVFAGDLGQLSHYFSFIWQRSADDTWECQLTPLTASMTKFLTEIKLQGNSRIEKLIILEASGNTTVIKLQSGGS